MPDPLLRFVHISDTHINPDPTYIKAYAQYTPLPGAQALVEAVNALPFLPDFILHTGDVAYDPDDSAYAAVAETLGELRAPVHYMAGNHDDMHALQTVVMGRSADSVQDHLHYTLDINGVQLIVLDSNGPHDPTRPSGTIPQEQLDWLADLLAAEDDTRPLVVATHHNPVPVNVPWLDDWMRMENGLDFHNIVKRAGKRLRGVFHGHIHQNIESYYDGVLYVAAASSWCQFTSYPMPENDRVMPDPLTPPGFTVVSITENSTALRRHSFAAPDAASSEG